jgi:hypothetical protein
LGWNAASLGFVALAKEIRNLWLLVERDLKDAVSGGMSHDWQYNIACNAALQLCTILLSAEGYGPGKGQLAHDRTLAALPLILGAQRQPGSKKSIPGLCRRLEIYSLPDPGQQPALVFACQLYRLYAFDSKPRFFRLSGSLRRTCLLDAIQFSAVAG